MSQTPVLIVDDDQDMRYACERFLRKSYDVTAVESCDEALKLLQNKSFAVIVMDLKMPGMTPEDLFAWMRRQCQDSVVILMTGSLSEEKRLDYVKRGAQSYLLKPFEMAFLGRAIDRALKLHEKTKKEQPLSGLRALVVEDDSLQLELLKIFLEARGCAVATAENGEEALAALEGDKPDLMFLDIVLPKINGFDVCRRVRENPGLKNLPIVFVTGKREEVGDDAIKKAPVNGVLHKPFDFLDLMELLQSLTTGYRR